MTLVFGELYSICKNQELGIIYFIYKLKRKALMAAEFIYRCSRIYTSVCLPCYFTRLVFFLEIQLFIQESNYMYLLMMRICEKFKQAEIGAFTATISKCI